MAFQAGADDAGLQRGLAHRQRALHRLHRSQGGRARQLELRARPPDQVVDAHAYRAQRAGPAGLFADAAVEHERAVWIAQAVGALVLDGQHERLLVVLGRSLEQRHLDRLAAPRVLRQPEARRRGGLAGVTACQPAADHGQVARSRPDIQVQRAHRVFHHQARADQLDLSGRGRLGIEDRRQRLQRVLVVGVGVALAVFHLDQRIGAIHRLGDHRADRTAGQRQQRDRADHAPVLQHRDQVVGQPQLGRRRRLDILGL
ncbi:hypothetical protein D9M70_506880 [compost metagenome]